MRLTRRLYVHDRVKLDLVAESFNLLNRDNQRVQFSDDGFLNTAGQFVQVDNQTGINHFPAQYRGQRTSCEPPTPMLRVKCRSL